MIFSFLQKISVKKKIELISPYFKNSESVLDFGCGDLSLAKAIKLKYPKLSITGVDVLPIKKNSKSIIFIQYNGKKIPFKNSSFDTVLSFYVLHHCKNIEEILQECIRVSKRRIIIVEACPRINVEIFFMSIVDWITNISKFDETPLSYQFYSVNKWKEIFLKFRLKVKFVQEVNLLKILPIGKTVLFELSK